MSYASNLKKLTASKLFSHIKDVKGKFWVGEDGVLHRHDGNCVPRKAVAAVVPDVSALPRSAARVFYPARPAQPARPGVPGKQGEVPLSEISADRLCSSCSYGFMWQSGIEQNYSVHSVEIFEDTRTRLSSALKVTKKTSASALQHRIDDLARYQHTLESTLASSSFPAKLRPAFEELLEAVSDGQVKLRAMSRSDVARAKVDEKLRALMVPKRFQSQQIQLDESLCIIGISPVPRGRGASTQVMAAIEAYSVRNDTAAVLVAPAFVYSFLLQQLFPKSSSDVLVVSAPAPDEEQVRETAAGIWDPEGASSLACMQAAIDAARAITA